MKKSKLLMPILGLSMIAPSMIMLSNCAKKSGPVQPTDSKEKESRDGDATISLKFNTKPDEGKADCSLVTSSSQELEIKTDNSNGSKETITVGDDLKANVKVGFVNIPSASCEVKFDLDFEYKVNGQTTTAQVKDCVIKFNRPTESEFTVTINKGDHGTVDKETLTVPTFTKWSEVKTQITVTPDKGFVFDKWVDKDGNEINNNMKVVNDFTAKAIYKTDEKPEGYYRVTFTNPDPSKGTIKGDLQQTIKKGTLFKEVKQPETEPVSGHLFIGWKNQQDEYMYDETPINADTTLRAVWTGDIAESGEYYTVIDGENWWYDDTTISTDDMSKKIVRYSLSTGESVEILRSQFNEPIMFGKAMTEIEDNFLNGCSTFNQQLELPSVQSIGNNFLYGCSAYNQDIQIPASVKSIGDYFLNFNTSDAVSFELTFEENSQLESIGDYFLENHKFVDKFSFKNCSKITKIGKYFLCGLKGSNFHLDLSDLKITTVPVAFLHSYGSYDQASSVTVTLPSTITNLSNGIFTSAIRHEIVQLNWQSTSFTIENNVIYKNRIAYQTFGEWDGNLNTSTEELADWFGSSIENRNNKYRTVDWTRAIANHANLTGLRTIGKHVYNNVALSGNSTLYLPQSIGYIGDYFMFNVSGTSVFRFQDPANCSLYRIGNYCLAQDSTCDELGRTIELNHIGFDKFSRLMSIGDNFAANLSTTLYNMTKLTAETSINFTGCTQLNSIGNNFLYKQNYQCTFQFPDNLKTIGDNFLYGNQSNSYSSNITTPSGLTKIGDGFMAGWHAYSPWSGTIDFSASTKLVSIGNECLSAINMNADGWFTGTVKFPTTTSGNFSLGSNFMSYQQKFDSPITLPTTTVKIGGNFLQQTKDTSSLRPGTFNQDFTIPSSVEYIGDLFLNGAYITNYTTPFSPAHKVTWGSSITHIGRFFFGRVSTHNWSSDYWNTAFVNIPITNGVINNSSKQTALKATRDFAPSSVRNEYTYKYYDDYFLSDSTVELTNSFSLLNGYSIGTNFLANCTKIGNITITLSGFQTIGEGFMNNLADDTVVTVRLNSVLASAFNGVNFQGKAHIKLVGESAKAVYDRFSQYNPNLTYEA